MPDALSKLIYPIDKSHLAPLRLVHFLALAVVVSRLTPPDWHGLMKPWMMAMIRCGGNSLAMYCFGVLLSFAGFVILTEISSSFAMHAAVSIAGIAPDGRGSNPDDLDSQAGPARAKAILRSGFLD